MNKNQDCESLRDLLSQAPPFDIDAEEAVVGALLLDPSRELFASVAQRLSAGDFYDDGTRAVFRSVELIQAANKPVDVTIVVSMLRSSGEYQSIGGAGFLGRLVNAVPNSKNAPYYAAIVKAKATLRKAIDIAVETVRDAMLATDDNCQSVLQTLRARADDALSDATDANESVTLFEAATQRLELLEHPEKSDLGRLVCTGIDCLDESYGGFRSGGSYVIAARPGHGKSALMKQICNSLDQRQKPTLVVSLEMDGHEIASRILSERTGIDGKFFEVDEDGECLLNAQQRLKVRDAVEKSRDTVMHIHAPTGRNATLAGITAFARLMVAKHGIKLVAVDYLQLIQKAHPKQSDYENVTECSKAFKRLARELGIAVIVLSQLNREGDKTAANRPARRPRLSDLRDSGAIEQDADGVIALHRPDEHTDDFELVVMKWRNDAPGVFNVRLVGELTRFDPQPVSQPDYHDEFTEWSR